MMQSIDAMEAAAMHATAAAAAPAAPAEFTLTFGGAISARTARALGATLLARVRASEHATGVAWRPAVDIGAAAGHDDATTPWCVVACDAHDVGGVHAAADLALSAVLDAVEADGELAARVTMAFEGRTYGAEAVAPAPEPVAVADPIGATMSPTRCETAFGASATAPPAADTKPAATAHVASLGEADIVGLDRVMYDVVLVGMHIASLGVVIHNAIQQAW